MLRFPASSNTHAPNCISMYWSTWIHKLWSLTTYLSCYLCTPCSVTVEHLPRPISSRPPPPPFSLWRETGGEIKNKAVREKVEKWLSLSPSSAPRVFTVNLRKNERSVSPVGTPPHSPSILSHSFIHTFLLHFLLRVSCAHQHVCMQMRTQRRHRQITWLCQKDCKCKEGCAKLDAIFKFQTLSLAQFQLSPICRPKYNICLFIQALPFLLSNSFKEVCA